jgi:hypothetical protein
MYLQNKKFRKELVMLSFFQIDSFNVVKATDNSRLIGVKFSDQFVSNFN